MNIVVEKSQYEIERGKPIPSKNHSFIQKRIGQFIDRNYLDKFEILPELSLEVNGKERVPDLAIFNYEDIDFTPGDDEIRVSNLPIGVVEILSPTQNLTELIVKSNTYFDAGILSYWLVLPDLKSIYVFSEKGEYESFTKNDMLIDTILNIQVGLEPIFKRKKK